jgi:uncharacterized protein (DUF885 family)
VTRSWTEIDRIADGYVVTLSALDPLTATEIGFPGHDAELPDLSPDGNAEISALRQRTLAALDSATPVDDCDRVTAGGLRDSLENSEQLRQAGTEESSLNNIASPLQSVRDVFDSMPTAGEADWAVIAARLAAVPAALAGYEQSLRYAAGRGQVAAVRQVRAGIEQSLRNTGPDGFFATFAAGAPALSAGLRSDLDDAALAAAGAYGGLAGFLRDELAPQAPERDAIGREAYPLHLRHFLGTDVDLDETYAWGIEECARIRAEMSALAIRIVPGGSIGDAMAALNADPDRQLAGTAALRAWMQRTSDTALLTLRGTHFDIADELMTLECRIAPTQNGGIYYSGPSDDFSRPGRMWWSVPPGVEHFTTWSETTTVYHEGVPGHHLQVAQAVHHREDLNSWRRLLSGTSGHAEGWALYAEQLMGELGFLDDPGDRIGMLDAQSFRAARVVIDIGVHCGLSAPAEVGGGDWTYAKAWSFLSAYSAMEEAARRFELDRYLGWPGQAPSYKIGERVWRQLRTDAADRDGADFDLRAFHARALSLGGLGLDALRSAVLGQ